MYNNINDNDNNNNNAVLLCLKRFIEISKKFLKQMNMEMTFVCSLLCISEVKKIFILPLNVELQLNYLENKK